MSFSFVLILIALAGPVWKKTPQPLLQKSLSRVIVLDLSYSMLATDIKPTRIERIRFKLEDLLKHFKEGETGLIGYAGEAFVISPLTHDPKTISSFLPGLRPNIMPVLGSYPEKAIELASELLKRSKRNNGHIILVTDGINDNSIPKIKNAVGDNNLSILAVGTKAGSPIAFDGGGFLKDKYGAIVIHKLNVEPMIKMANEVNGIFTTLSLNDDDVEIILSLESTEKTFVEEKNNKSTDIWEEEGPLFLLISLPLIAFLFRKGLLFSLFIPIIMSFVSVIYPHTTYAFEWTDLWLRIDQQAEKLFEQGKTKDAAQLFENKEWKGVASYRSGEFDSAIKYFAKKDNPRSKFNLANSLAMSGRFKESIEIYENILSKNPEYEDAKFNKELIEKYLGEQQKKKQDENNKDGNSTEKSGNKKNNSKLKDVETKKQNKANIPKNNDSKINNESETKNKGKPKKSVPNDKKELNEDEVKSSKKVNNKKNNDESHENKVNSNNHELNYDRQTKAQSLEQWLRKIPDDPSLLLRNKMHREFNRRGKNTDQNEQYW